MSTTAKGRSIISTSMTTFERFMGNTIKFRCVDECIVFINRICSEPEVEICFDIQDRTKEEVIEKLFNECQEHTKINLSIISKFINNREISQHTLNKLYYKNNFYEFLSNRSILTVFEGIVKLDNLIFRDPNEIPEDICNALENLWKAFEEYVLHTHIVHGKQDILKYNPREVVLGVDTDSNFLYLGKYYTFLKEHIDIEETDENIYKLANTMTAILARVIAKVYSQFTELCNVPEEHRWLISMKSEFLWRRVLFASGSKNYASIAMLQEGKELGDKPDIKGLAMKKSSVNKNTAKSLQGLLENGVLKSKDINVTHILNEIYSLENKIRDSFLNGECEFLTPKSCKVLSAYKNPYGEASIKGVIAWNAVYPNNPIVLPESFNLAKCTIKTKEDMKDLQQSHPEIYKALEETVFNDSALAKYGVSYFAIPKSESKLPDWIIPYIDVETIVNDNISVFNPILNSLGVQVLSVDNKSFYSNVLKL